MRSKKESALRARARKLGYSIHKSRSRSVNEGPGARSDFVAFFSEPRFPSIGRSISFWPAAALRGLFGFFDVSLAMLCRRASIRFTTLSARGWGFGPIALPYRAAPVR
jgi:hypothetical protein